MTTESQFEDASIGVFFARACDRRLLCEYLAQLGVQSWAPTSDHEFLEGLDSGLLAQHLLLITDLEVAMAFGDRLLKAAHEVHPQFPVYIVLPKDSSQTYWLHQGFSDVLTLPLTKAKLKARLFNSLRQGQAAALVLKEINEKLRVQNQSLREAQKQAQAASRAKNQFLANMSHELRTPLHGIVTCLTNLHRAVTEEQDKEQLRAAQMSADILLTLVNDLLDFANLELGEMKLTTRVFRPQDLLEALRLPLQARADKKGLTFRWETEGLPERLESDPARLSQIINNLCGNAIKFTSEGEVGVGVSWEDGCLKIVIDDTGPGIPDADQERVFRRFQQVDGSNTRVHEGAGLGLSIVRQLVDAFCGRTELHSIPGDGSVFTVYLPCEVPGRAELTPQEPERMEPLHILVVEDNPIAVVALQRMLEGWGHQVSVAKDGQAALAAHEKRPDFIIMDYQLPGLAGPDVTREIRRRERERGLARTPILALTARAQEEDQRVCLESGMDGYLSKPPVARVLQETIARLSATVS